MKKALKFTAFGLIGLLALLLVVAGIFAATFNPNDYKSLIVKLVQEKKQRTLHLDGDIKLAFWPKLGADLGKISLSEHNGNQEFASINSAKVSLALLPLLKKQLVVDTVYVDGVNANIIRFKDGTTNFDDLISKDEEASEEVKFDVDGINITNTSINFADEMRNAKYHITQFNLKTGHVALARPFDIKTNFKVQASNPNLNANFKLSGNFMADADAKHYVAKDLEASVKGTLATLTNADITLAGDVDAKPENIELLVDGFKFGLSGNQAGADLAFNLAAPKLRVQKEVVTGKQAIITFSQTKRSDVTKASLTIADLKGSPQLLESSGISGEVSMKQGARYVQSKFSSPFSGNLEKMIFDLPKLSGKIDVTDPSLPKGEMKGDFAFKLHTDVKQELVNSDYNLNIDGTQLNGNVSVASFSKPAIKFNLNANQLDLNKLFIEKSSSSSSAPNSPTDLSVLKDLLVQGNINVGKIIYDKYQLANLNLGLKADGEQLNIAPFSVKFDESQVKGGFGISQFAKPAYHFDINIDKLDADQYITKSDKPAATKSSTDTPIDLSALKKLNAEGALNVGSLKVANVKTSNVHIKLKANQGVAELTPFSANLYEGSMSGSLRVDARSTPNIAFKQNMTGIAIGPLMVDAINNDMLNGKGTLNVDITASGNTVGALKKSLNGTAGVNLADGAVKGVDIAGTLRSIKDKLNIMKQASAPSDKTQKTDFSEMVASFSIKNGVAHNEDLSIKAPLFRIGGNGDIDIGNETINYSARPTIVNSLKGQGGSDLSLMNGLTIPIKVTGTFAKPNYGFDFSGLAAGIAKNKLLENIGGKKADTVKSLLGLPKAENSTTGNPATAPAPASIEDKAKKKLNKLLGF
jgi:AsmA protein